MAGEPIPMPSTKVELLPCPFCGGSGRAQSHRIAEDAMVAFVSCARCGVQTEHFEDAYAPTAQAIDAWNTRTPSHGGEELREDWRQVLSNLIHYVERTECEHESTRRGGTIWTICNDCEQQWADDQGGFKPYVQPKPIAKAYALLASPPPVDRAEAGEQMTLAVALDFAEKPRRYATLQAPADTMNELREALAVLAAAYRAAQPLEGLTSGEGKTHNIKCWPDVFEEMRAGRKTAEFRYNDRGYAVGDMLLIREWDTATAAYTHREITRQITHVLDGGFGMPAGYVMLSLAASPSQPTNEGLTSGEGALAQSAAQYAAICGRLADQVPVAGEPDPLWWERQSALREAGVLLSHFAALDGTRVDAGEQGWDHRYRPLNRGEIIKPTDECRRDTGEWVTGICVGEPAPDPAYSSHRIYRRLKTSTGEGLTSGERVPKLKPGYPDYVDDPDGLARFREQVKRSPGHDMAICNNNSLGRLIDTIERLRAERDRALAASPSNHAGSVGEGDRYANDEAAKALYDSWSDQPGWVPWVERGNSAMQERARREVSL